MSVYLNILDADPVLPTRSVAIISRVYSAAALLGKISEEIVINSNVVEIPVMNVSKDQL